MAAMAGTSAWEILRIAGLSERSGDRNRCCVERRQGGADRIDFASQCGMRTPGEQSLRWMMLTRRQIRIAPCGAPPPRISRGEREVTLCAVMRGDDDARAI